MTRQPGDSEKGRAGPGDQAPPPVAVQKCYDLVLYLLQRIEKFPRAHKFTVGDRLAAAVLDVLEDLVAAAYSRDKRELLGRANLRLHRVRFLHRLRLLIHPRKSRVYRCREGVTFLGWRIFPERLRLVRGNVVRFKRRARGMQRDFAAGAMTWPEVHERIRAWIAHAENGNTWRLRERVLGDLVFRRGYGV